MTQRRILIIEDEPDIGDIMQMTLEGEGCKVVKAINLEDINRALCEQDHYDACFVDSGFPLRVGQKPEDLGEVAVTLIAEHAHEHHYKPALIFTSADRYKAREMADKYGGRPMSKPFGIEDIGVVLEFAMQAANPEPFDLYS